MNAVEREALLRTYPVLQSLPLARFERIQDAAVRLQAPPGTRLFDAGDACTHQPLVIEGRVRVAKCGSDGDEILLYQLLPGETCVITAVTLLGASRYPATGTVEEEILAFALPRNLFVELVLESQEFRVFVFKTISERMANLMALVDNLAFRGVAERLAMRLLSQEQPIALTHQMLSDELGTSREVVSRILKSFEQSGLVQLGRKRIEILDRRALHNLHRSTEA